MTPDELKKLKEQMTQNMSAAMDFVFSEANPFFRAAEQMKQGKNVDDTLARELCADAQRIEARGWLEEGTRMKQKRFVHTYSTPKTSKLVEELYAAGAKTVWIVDPDVTGKWQTSDVLLVALPESPEQRFALARIQQREMAKVWCSEPDDDVSAPSGEHILFQYT
jgi:hypothetical protein